MTRRAVADHLAKALTNRNECNVGHFSQDEAQSVRYALPLNVIGGLSGAGAAAILLTMLHRQAAGDAVPAEADQLLRYAVQTAPPQDVTLSTGWAGLLLTARVLAGDTSNYRRFRNAVTQSLSDACEALTKLPLEDSVTYELLRGNAGIFIAMEGPEGATGTANLVNFFDRLTADGLEPWCLPNSIADSPKPRNRLGVAHGLAGVLGALCCRPREPGVVELIARIAGFFVSQRRESPWGLQWPFAVRRSSQWRESQFRVAWCNYSLGISCVIAAAGTILGDSSYVLAARDAASRLLLMPYATWGMRDASLCHGTAGNALLLRYLGDLTSNKDLHTASGDLIDLTVDQFDPAIPFGFRYHRRQAHFSDATLISGAAGTALCLAACGPTLDTSWLGAIGLSACAHEIAMSRQNVTDVCAT